MLLTKFRRNRSDGSGEEYFVRVCTIHVHGYCGDGPDAANKPSFPYPKGST